jgi:choline dehydrogenase-like flavoprotein
VPPSYSDKVLAGAVDGMAVAVGAESVRLTVRNYPAARNSIPRGDYRPVGAVDGYASDAAVRDLGERCAGNTACTPICPIQARYHAGKTLAQADRRNLEVIAQAVASKVLVDPVSGAVTGIEYQRYDDPSSPRHTVHVATARAYVLAAHAVENAKLLASGLTGAGGGALVGKGLMDHPALYAWGLAPVPVGAFRGPLSTAGIEDLRGGSFRAEHAAFRFDVGNDGWRAPTGAPDSTVAAAVTGDGLYGSRLRGHLAQTLPRQVRFSIAVEQLRSADNNVTIDPRHVDPLGNPRPVLRYHLDDYTLAGMAAATGVYREVFRRAGIEDRTDPERGTWFPSVPYGDQVFHYHGMGHLAGTHVMGGSAEDSVVDPDQRSWQHRNLYLVGAGSFPTMGTSNPTLTTAALSLRTAKHMTSELAGAG